MRRDHPRKVAWRALRARKAQAAFEREFRAKSAEIDAILQAISESQIDFWERCSKPLEFGVIGHV